MERVFAGALFSYRDGGKQKERGDREPGRCKAEPARGNPACATGRGQRPGGWCGVFVVAVEPSLI